jgi:hypothetical protein
MLSPTTFIFSRFFSSHSYPTGGPVLENECPFLASLSAPLRQTSSRDFKKRLSEETSE